MVLMMMMSTNHQHRNSSSMTDSSSADCFDASGQVLEEHWVLNRALGALVGACIGDATGAPLERLGRFPSESDVRLAMHLTGTPRTGPRINTGSLITDDSEMTIALASGLAECCRRSDRAAFDLELLAEKYAEWVRSAPPDMGLTVGAGIGVARSLQSSFVEFERQPLKRRTRSQSHHSGTHNL